MHTHRIDFQQFDTIRSRSGLHPPPNAMHTHTIDFQLFDEIRIGLYSSHRLDCHPFDTIRFGSYPPPHTMYTHKIDFQPFDTSRQVWNIILPHMPCTHMGLISSHLTKSGLHRTLHHMPCMHIILISSHLTKSGLDSTLPYVPCTHICFISSHLTKSGLDHTLPNMSCTHIRLIASHLTKSGLDSTLPHVPCTHMCLISRHLIQSGLDRTLPHKPCTHRIHLQPFDKIRFGLYLPPRAMHTFPAICWFPSLCSERYSLRWYSGFPLPIIPISNIIPSVKFFYIPFLTETVPLWYIL